VDRISLEGFGQSPVSEGVCGEEVEGESRYEENITQFELHNVARRGSNPKFDSADSKNRYPFIVGNTNPFGLWIGVVIVLEEMNGAEEGLDPTHTLRSSRIKEPVGRAVYEGLNLHVQRQR
jgi:hypothetical protein